MINFEKIDFYITNVCNLNCENCVTFNNYNFKGHLKWQDYSDLYKQWSKILDIENITLIGGEPLLNPDLLNWVQGLRNLWPRAKTFTIQSNGTQLHNWPKLYDHMKEDNRLRIWISLHGGDSEKLAHESIAKFFKGSPLKPKTRHESWQSTYRSIKGADWPDCTIEEFNSLPEHIKKECREQFNVDPRNFDWNEDNMYIDHNGVEIFIQPNSKLFYTTSIVYDNSIHNVRFHNSDPKKAWDICGAKICKTPRFFKAKLYKCAPLPNFQDAIDQFSIKLPESDIELIRSYQAAEANWNQNQLETFKDSLNHHVDQCKFCPEEKNFILTAAGTKKRKIYPIVDKTTI